jgi:alpha-L-fucosidase
LPTYESLRQRSLPDWFQDVKLGVMVVWGLFSVPAWAPLTGNLPEVAAQQGWEAMFTNNPYAEWYMNTMRFEGSPTHRHHLATYGPHTTYDDFVPLFNAAVERWNPEDWAALYEEAGIKYVVFLTKHHDGFLLWPSQHTSPHKSIRYAVRRDIPGELTAAVRKRSIRMGMYYSGGLDWSFKHVQIRSQATLFECVPQMPEYVEYADLHWRDLIARYQPSLLWNDIAYPRGAHLPALFADYYNAVPDGVINDRFGQQPPHTDPVDDEILAPPAGEYWDFRTPEYSSYSEIKPFKWEATRGLGYSFSYNQNEGDAHTIPADTLIRMLADVVSKNGNLLLSFGPMADGTVPPEQRDRLVKLGAWLKVNGEAIYGTRPWLRAEGRTADGLPIRFTRKGEAVYAILLEQPRGGALVIEDFAAPPDAQITLLGHEAVLPWRAEGTGIVVSLPPALALSVPQAAYTFKVQPTGSA